MVEMRKDETIERAFRGYFNGADLPHIDLTAAKQELRASALRRDKIRRGLKWQIPSAVACLLVLVLLAVNLLPSLFARRYTVADTKPEAVSYTELKEQYGDRMNMFTKFSFSDNASASYTLYSVEGEAVLLGVELGYISGFNTFRATVYIELDRKGYKTKDFESYKDLKEKRSDYTYETEYMNGEYVSRATFERDDWIYYVDLTSPYEKTFRYFMLDLLK